VEGGPNSDEVYIYVLCDVSIAKIPKVVFKLSFNFFLSKTKNILPFPP
jgi:hypothetical protein